MTNERTTTNNEAAHERSRPMDDATRIMTDADIVCRLMDAICDAGTYGSTDEEQFNSEVDVAHADGNINALLELAIRCDALEGEDFDMMELVRELIRRELIGPEPDDYGCWGAITGGAR
jgi:hypothetical protein